MDNIIDIIQKNKHNMSSNEGWSKHPRPQQKRDNYYILKENWTLNRMPITMPYPPQSMLSGFKHGVGDVLFYKTTFRIPASFNKKRILLHFGAVDQVARVKLNGKNVGDNEGGYLPFTFDVSDEINRYGENILEVAATDKLDTDYPYGKQSKKPSGMWYTPVSGIWQNVWLENVPDIYINGISFDTDLFSVKVDIRTNKKVDGFKVSIDLPDGDLLNKNIEGTCGTIKIRNPVHWTCDKPYLYHCKIYCGEDAVESYFGLRTISIEKKRGINRVCLNGDEIFLHGVLDQGYFHDGLYIPKMENGYDNDIMAMKELGFNLLRKHVKIEPEYFYYACDRLGIMVMQDMVNSGEYNFIRDTAKPTAGFKKKEDVMLPKSDRRRKIFETQVKNTIKHLYNHPSVIAYTVFNEGWGQFNSDEMYDFVKEYDKTRLVDTTSGWFPQNKSDFDSEHVYFKNKVLRPKERPMFVTECGGYKFKDYDHFYGNKEYGYGSCKTKGDYMCKIEDMYERMIIPGISKGVCGCIYTQLCDVEGEINGLYTYDREVCKVDVGRMLQIKKKIETA